MKEPFLYSDPHFFHENICKWEGARPWDDATHMAYEMRDKWNAVVGPEDHVIILGDLFNRKALDLLPQLNGKKTLIMGNHDQAPIQAYVDAGVHKLLSSYEMAGCICTHIPIHPCQLERWKANLHGHTHHNNVKLSGPSYRVTDGYPVKSLIQPGNTDDPRYVNMCVEKWDYTPVKLSVVLNELRKRGVL